LSTPGDRRDTSAVAGLLAEDRIEQADRHDLRIILVCNEGYASSLAAESLRRMGLFRATDLEGGYRAWRRRQGMHRGQ
jgi:rhodanese-related sulfurtransferase